VRTVRTIAELRELLAAERRAGRSIGLVPTMGFFHDGHLSLMRRARADNDVLVVSLFVNPTQFAPGEDFAAYPRDEQRDAELAAAEGVDILFSPPVEEVYPGGFDTTVVVGGLTETLEGDEAQRGAEHFQGVTTVVTKLFNVIRPQFAFFGRKDAQQAIIIKRMAEDLCIDTEIVVCPIVRDDDGLALSSRNAYLSAEERSAATVLHRALEKAQVLYGGGERDAETIVKAIEEVVSTESLVRIDYISVVNTKDLEPVQTLSDDQTILIALAAFVGKTRLIDNVVLNGEI